MQVREKPLKGEMSRIREGTLVRSIETAKVGTERNKHLRVNSKFSQQTICLTNNSETVIAYPKAVGDSRIIHSRHHSS